MTQISLVLVKMKTIQIQGQEILYVKTYRYIQSCIELSKKLLVENKEKLCDQTHSGTWQIMKHIVLFESSLLSPLTQLQHKDAHVPYNAIGY